MRPNREPYFPAGRADEWDRWFGVMAPGIVRRGNYTYLYYVFSDNTLRLNIDTGSMGTAFAELRDAEGKTDRRLHARRLRSDRRKLHRSGRALERLDRCLVASGKARTDSR